MDVTSRARRFPALFLLVVFTMFSAVSISAVAQVNSLGYQLTYTFKGTVYDSLLAAENAMREDAGATVTVDAYGNKSYAGNYPSFDNSTNGASPA